MLIVSMLPAPLFAEVTPYLDEVVVTARSATRDVVATNVTVITREEIEQTQATTVQEVLKNFGYGDVSNTGTLGANSTIRVRTIGNANHTLVMLDGQPLTESGLGTTDIDTIPTDMIDRIEIIRGPASALWGANAVAGVVNIITKKTAARTPAATLDTTFGTFGRQRIGAHGSAMTERGVQYLFSAGEDRSDGFRKNSAYNGNDMFIRFATDEKMYGSVALQCIYQHSNTRIPGKNNTPINNYNGEKEREASSPDAWQDDTKRYVQMQHTIHFDSSHYALETKLYGMFTDRRYEWQSSWTATLSSVNTFGFEQQMQLPYHGVVGIGLCNEQFQRKNVFTLPSVIDVDGSRATRSVFAQKTLEVSNFSTDIGLRYDDNTVFGGEWNPRMSASYRPLDALRFSANVGRAFRVPTFEDLFSPFMSWPASSWGSAGDTAGSSDVKSETSWGYDAGIAVQCLPSLSTEITWFKSDITNLIAWRDVSTISSYEKWRPVNVGTAYHNGVECTIHHVILDGLSHDFAYTYLDAQGRNLTTGTYQRLEYTPFHRFHYALALHHRGFLARTDVHFTDEQKWDKGQLDSYTTVDTTLSYTSLSIGELFFSVYNITDERYQTRIGYPLPGREFRAGVKIRM